MSTSKVPKKYEPNPVPALRKENLPPTIISQTLPPALKKDSFPLAYYEKTIDVSDFVDFLHQIDQDAPSFFLPFEKSLKSKCKGLGKRMTIKESDLPLSISTLAGPKFTHVMKPTEEEGSDYLVLACILIFSRNQNILDINKLNLLIAQTKSFCQNLGISATLAKKLDLGLKKIASLTSIEILGKEKDFSPLFFALRQMNLMVLIHYPEILAWVHPEGVDKYLKNDYLLELIHPEEGVSTYTLLALMKALDSLCLILVEEGKGTIKVHRPTEQIVQGVAIYRSGGQFYLLEGS